MSKYYIEQNIIFLAQKAMTLKVIVMGNRSYSWSKSESAFSVAKLNIHQPYIRILLGAVGHENVNGKQFYFLFPHLILPVI